MANPTQWTEHDIRTFAASFSDPVELVRAVLRQVEANALASTPEPVAVVVPIDGHASNVPRNRMLSVLRDLPQVGTHLYELPGTP